MPQENDWILASARELTVERVGISVAEPSSGNPEEET
jgi:hypothetical protein